MILKERKKVKRIGFGFILISVIFLSIFQQNYNYHNNEYQPPNDGTLKISAFDATFNFTNNWIDGTRHAQGDTILITARLFNRLPLPDGDPRPNYNVQLLINSNPDIQNTTNSNGDVQFNYTIPYSSNVFAPLNISATVTNASFEIEYYYTDITSYYLIYSNTTSEFVSVQVDKTKPYLTGETIDMSGNLEYGNSTGISNTNIGVYWYTDDMSTLVSSDIISTNLLGEIPDIIVPDISNPLMRDNMTLLLNYSNGPAVGYSELNITKILVFQNATFSGLSQDVGTSRWQYTVTGQIQSAGTGFALFNRTVSVLFNYTYWWGEAWATTAANGSFSISFIIDADFNGTCYYEVLLSNTPNKYIRSFPIPITVNPAPYIPGGGIGDPAAPFAMFLMIFIPIVVVIGALLAVAGYMFLKKQREEAQVTSIPLESKIKNLKILKESKRMEESLSYLFNAIFLTLIDARSGRVKKDYETIRDFAIISVKELKLKPAIIYPFITSVEEIIYSRPFEITDDDFYRTIEVFSPVFYALTGHNFILNF